MANGTVCHVFQRQMAFIIPQEGGGPDVIVHISAVERMSNPNEGQKLSFDIGPDRRSGNSAAPNLQAA